MKHLEFIVFFSVIKTTYSEKSQQKLINDKQKLIAECYGCEVMDLHFYHICFISEGEEHVR